MNLSCTTAMNRNQNNLSVICFKYGRMKLTVVVMLCIKTLTDLCTSTSAYFHITVISDLLYNNGQWADKLKYCTINMKNVT